MSLSASLSERFKRCLQGQVESVVSNGAAVVCSDRLYGGELATARPADYMPLLNRHGFRCELGHDELGGLCLRVWPQLYKQRRRVDVSAVAKKKKGD